MISIKTIADKNIVHSGENNKTILFQLTGLKSKKSKKQQLNLSLVIDVSTSMNQYVSIGKINYEPIIHNDYHSYNSHILKNNIINDVNVANMNNLNDFFNSQKKIIGNTKMDLVKKAAIQSINLLSDDDYISIVTFGSNSHVILSNVKATESNKKLAINKILGLHASGNTNLHNGWVDGSIEIAKNQSDNVINRVLLLTDGEITAGLSNIPTILKNVSDLNNKGISTSTFGVGDSFNEDLLTKIADVGGGNFYYIQNESEFLSTFNEEFTGLSNLCAKNIEFSIELNSGKIVKNLNSLEMLSDKFLVPNIFNNKTLNLLFSFNFNIDKKIKNFKFGTVQLNFIDIDGNKHSLSQEINFECVSKKTFDDTPKDSEVNVQETLMIISQNKILATKEIDMGNIAGARSILNSSEMYLSSSGINDDRILKEKISLKDTITASTMSSSQAFRKDLSYQSYKTRSGKDD